MLRLRSKNKSKHILRLETFLFVFSASYKFGFVVYKKMSLLIYLRVVRREKTEYSDFKK